MSSSGMNMDRFHGRHDAVSSNSGMEFGDIPKLIVSNGLLIRLIGDFASVYEHFIETPNGLRPYYCEGLRVIALFAKLQIGCRLVTILRSKSLVRSLRLRSVFILMFLTVRLLARLGIGRTVSLSCCRRVRRA